MFQLFFVSHKTLITSAMLVLGALAPAALASPPVKLTASDASVNDLFGISVSISGNTAIVGSYLADGTAGVNQGAAYVYTRTGTTWAQQAKLTAADAAPRDRFGISVSINGDTAIVGAYFDDDPGSVNQGAAYIFTRTGTTWTQQAKLTAADATGGQNFGFSVSINADTAIVGAIGADAAYVFTRTGTIWTQQAKLTAADAGTVDFFGTSVSINGNTAIVGASAADGTAGVDQGKAYIFTRSGTAWTQQEKLTASDASASDNFGRSVSINGNTAIVGALTADGAAGVNQGKAYIFTRSGTAWTQLAKLTAADATLGNLFGASVSLVGDTAIVGAISANGIGGSAQGAAYIFTRSGAVWTQLSKLTAPDGAANDSFGGSVSIIGNTAIVGAQLAGGTASPDQGAAYIFTLCLQDLDGDSTVNGADLGLLLGNWGGAGITDINGDGTTDGADLGLLLGAWGACP